MNFPELDGTFLLIKGTGVGITQFSGSYKNRKVSSLDISL
jgi:hypothetical protein